MGSLKVTSTERTKNRLALSAKLTLRTCGPKVSGTTVTASALDRPTLPPVSVALTCKVSVVPPVVMAGTWASKSKGKLRSVATT